MLLVESFGKTGTKIERTLMRKNCAKLSYFFPNETSSFYLGEDGLVVVRRKLQA